MSRIQIDPTRLAAVLEEQAERFLSLPNFVAEPYTGIPGKYVAIDESVKGFSDIINGSLDAVPEQAFMMADSIDSVRRKAEGLAEHGA